MDAQAMPVQDAPRPRTGPGRLGTLLVMGVTGAIILAVAVISNQPAVTTSADGAVTSVTLTGIASGEPPVVGKIAPDFVAAAADGTQFRLSDLKGSPVWLTFGASWCQPCRAENPDIQAAYEKYRAQGLVVVQVYITEDAKTVSDYSSRVGLTYPKIPDRNERIAAEYRILGIPSHFFIDRAGVLRQLRIGSFDPAGMESAVKAILQ